MNASNPFDRMNEWASVSDMYKSFVRSNGLIVFNILETNFLD